MKVCTVADCQGPCLAKGLCRKHYLRSHYKKNSGARKAEARLKKTGFTPEDVARFLAAQEGRCGICYRPMTDGKVCSTKMCADHDHATGALRGLLCFRCNRALGSYELMRDLGAASYLGE